MSDNQNQALATYLADMLEEFSRLAESLNDELFVDLLKVTEKAARQINARLKA